MPASYGVQRGLLNLPINIYDVLDYPVRVKKINKKIKKEFDNILKIMIIAFQSQYKVLYGLYLKKKQKKTLSASARSKQY